MLGRPLIVGAVFVRLIYAEYLLLAGTDKYMGFDHGNLIFTPDTRLAVAFKRVPLSDTPSKVYLNFTIPENKRMDPSASSNVLKNLPVYMSLDTTGFFRILDATVRRPKKCLQNFDGIAKVEQCPIRDRQENSLFELRASLGKVGVRENIVVKAGKKDMNNNPVDPLGGNWNEASKSDMEKVLQPYNKRLGPSPANPKAANKPDQERVFRIHPILS